MAKDPAFLFYPGDWMGGTMILNRHQKGCYMDLLIAQFNNGPLSLETIKTILGQDQASWTVLSKKFKQDSSGNFFNERLVTEIEKRKEYCNKQSERVKKRWVKDGIYHGNTTVIPKIENENEIKDEIRGRGAVEGELWTDVVQHFFNDFNWKEKFCRDKKLDQIVLEHKMKKFITDLELKEETKPLKELKSHFVNWFNLNRRNGTSKTTAASTFLNGVKEDIAEYYARGAKNS